MKILDLPSIYDVLVELDVAEELELGPLADPPFITGVTLCSGKG